MKCRGAAKWFVETDIAELPAEVREHIENCADCRRLFEDNRFAARIVSLKKYEQPAIGASARISEGIRTRIETSANSGLERFAFKDLRYFIKPAAHIAAAIVFIVLIGSFFFHRDPVNGNGAHINADNHYMETSQIHSSRPDWMADPTNASPDEIQYGPQESRVVEFEFDSEDKQ